MKKTISQSLKLLIVTGFLGLTMLPVSVMAVTAAEDIKDQLNPIKDIYYDTSTDPNPDTFIEAIANIVKIALGFLGIIFVILIIYAGFMWMTAAGSEERISKAKKIMIAAIIGVAIVLSAYLITYFVIDQLLRATGAAESGLN